MKKITKRMFMATPVLAALCFVIVSCATVGRDFPADAVTQIKIGSTTKEDIRNLFGPPWRIGIEDGQRTWTYGYYQYSAFRPSRTRDLVVRFDQRDMVVSYSFNTTDTEQEKSP